MIKTIKALNASKNRSYKVTKSEWYSEKDKHLYSSYDFKYLSPIDNEWHELRNVGRIDELRNMVIENSNLLGKIIKLPRLT